MLRLILGPDWVTIRESILNSIAQDTSSRRGGRIWIVPELISHDTERRLCQAAGDTVSRYAEVLSFTRLSRRVSEEMGGDRGCLDAGGRIVAMAAAAKQLHSRLKAYAAVESKPEFLAAMVEAVDEFKRCCVSGADLRQAAGQTEGALAQKLEELALLMDTYDALCQRGKRDPRDQMSCLLEQLAAGDFAQRHHFYMDCFPDFSRQHLEILQQLIQTSPCVTLGFHADRPNTGKLAFEKAGQTAGELLRFAKDAGIPTEVVYLPPEETPLAGVCESLFQGALRPNPAVRAWRADSVYHEVQAVAEEITRLVRSGCRYRDISLVCCDMASYRGALQQVFDRFGIPLYVAGTESILGKTVVSALICAMEAALGGFDRQEVLRYLRSLLSPLSLDECDRLENYAVVWGIRGKRWQEPWTLHPDGPRAEWTEEARQRLEDLERCRKAGVEPLIRLSRAFREAENLAGQMQGLYRFLEEVELARRLTDMAQELERAGDDRSAQILNQMWEILMTAMEQLYAILGQTVWEPETFTRLFALLLGQYDVGTIPAVLDAVSAGAVSAQRCQQARHLFVLGAVEGALPAYGSSSGVLTDQERGKLRGLGLPLNSSASEKLKNEFAEICGVFCGARETVTVSYPGGQCSYIYRRLADMTGGEQLVQPGLGAAVADPQEAGILLWNRREAAAAERLGLTQWYEESERWANYGLGGVSGEHIRALYGQKLRLSPSQVDQQAECRMAYFLRYGLRLRECREATEDPTAFGSFIHKVLERTVQGVMARGGFHQVPLEQTQELAAQAVEECRLELGDPSQRADYLFQRNRQEVALVVQELWQELSRISFQPAEWELGFDEGEKMPPIQIPAGQMQAALEGRVDRVDTAELDGKRYFRVVDYKSGKKDFDYCDIYNGVGLQMLLYLFALEKAGEGVLGPDAQAAGVQYFPARMLPVKADSHPAPEEIEDLRIKELKRQGLLLKDGGVIQAMAPEGDLRRLCCTEKKGALEGDLADPAQMRLLEGHVFRVLENMVDEIASGNVTPNPYTRGDKHDACRYCPYGAVCHSATVAGRRNYKEMKAADFWKRLEEEKHG